MLGCERSGIQVMVQLCEVDRDWGCCCGEGWEAARNAGNKSKLGANIPVVVVIVAFNKVLNDRHVGW